MTARISVPVRLALGLLVAVALTLMHGGVGQAASCGAFTVGGHVMSQMTPAHAMSPQPHPQKPPLTAHGGEMCSAWAPSHTALSGTAGSAITAIHATNRASYPPTLSAVKGIIPRPEDPVTMLCVNRS